MMAIITKGRLQCCIVEMPKHRGAGAMSPAVAVTGKLFHIRRDSCLVPCQIQLQPISPSLHHVRCSLAHRSSSPGCSFLR